jgi:ribosomal protein S14
MATQPAPTCARCQSFARYQSTHNGQPASLCARHFALCRAILRRAATTALIVGTLLTALNQGDILLAGDTTSAMLWKVPLTYLVPFSVTIWGALTRAD